jgi:uncharacterized membrane protein
MQQPDNVIQEADELPFPTVRDIKATSPLRWFSNGWQDMKACPIPSLFYGFCFAGMGLLITFVFEHAYEYTSGLTSGFLLLGPFLAMGLYEISRRREKGQGCSLAPTLVVWKRNAGNIGVFAVVLGIVFLVWARASLVVFALFYTDEMPNLSGFLEQILRFENLEFLMVYFAVGLLFATIVFAVSVVSIPLMLDRNRDAGQRRRPRTQSGHHDGLGLRHCRHDHPRLHDLPHRPGDPDADRRPCHLACLPGSDRAPQDLIGADRAHAGGLRAASSISSTTG